MFANATMTLPRTREAVPVVRDGYVAIMRSLGVERQLVDDLAVAISETTTNAVLHGDGPELRTNLEIDNGMITFSVRDRGPGFSLDSKPELPDPRSAHGRGLAIVAAFVETVDVIQLESGGVEVRLQTPVKLASDDTMDDASQAQQVAARDRSEEAAPTSVEVDE